MHVLGIDVGGSGIKAALVDAEEGELRTERRRLRTPETFEREAVIQTIGRLVEDFDYQGPLGVGFPSVIVDGVVMSAPTSSSVEGWMGINVANHIGEVTGCPTTVLNDADVAGLAEMKFGNGRGRRGTVMVFTLGTGIGSSLFYNGNLVPNLELGWLYLPGQRQTAEDYAADRVRDEEDLSWEEWGERLDEYFNHIERLFSPTLIIIGGGVSKEYEEFLKYIDVRAELLPAKLLNEAGIVGAAMAALEA